LFISLYVKRFN